MVAIHIKPAGHRHRNSCCQGLGPNTDYRRRPGVRQRQRHRWGRGEQPSLTGWLRSSAAYTDFCGE